MLRGHTVPIKRLSVSERVEFEPAEKPFLVNSRVTRRWHPPLRWRWEESQGSRIGFLTLTFPSRRSVEVPIAAN